MRNPVQAPQRWPARRTMGAAFDGPTAGTLEAIAKARGVTVPDLLREIVRDYLNARATT